MKTRADWLGLGLLVLGSTAGWARDPIVIGEINPRVDPTVRTKHHQKIRLAFIADRIHFFDNKTDEAIA